MEILKPYRKRIDTLDDKIVDLLIERVGIIHDVADIKFQENIPAILPDRVDEVRERAAARAAEKGIDPDLVRQLYTILINYSCDLEETIMTKKSAEDKNSSHA